MRKICIINHKGYDIEVRSACRTHFSANIYIKDLFLGTYIRQQLHPEKKLDKSFEDVIATQLQKWREEEAQMGCDIKKVNGRPRASDKTDPWEIHYGTKNQRKSLY